MPYSKEEFQPFLDLLNNREFMRMVWAMGISQYLIAGHKEDEREKLLLDWIEDPARLTERKSETASWYVSMRPYFDYEKLNNLYEESRDFIDKEGTEAEVDKPESYKLLYEFSSGVAHTVMGTKIQLQYSDAQMLQDLSETGDISAIRDKFINNQINSVKDADGKLAEALNGRALSEALAPGLVPPWEQPVANEDSQHDAIAEIRGALQEM